MAQEPYVIGVYIRPVALLAFVQRRENPQALKVVHEVAGGVPGDVEAIGNEGDVNDGVALQKLQQPQAVVGRARHFAVNQMDVGIVQRRHNFQRQNSPEK